MHKMINVYSEIGKLKKVLVHTPGEEINYIAPSRLDELLFSAILEPNTTRKEHQEFCKLLQDNGVEVVQLVDLFVQTWNLSSKEEKDSFIQRWLDESSPKLDATKRQAVQKFIESLTSDPYKMVRKMMSGVFASEVGLAKYGKDDNLIVDPMPNLYFTRDPFSSVGNGVVISNMKYTVRKRETIFCDFIFRNNPEFKNTPILYTRQEIPTIEGGDVFVYSEGVLTIGVSERTTKDAIELIAKKIKSDPENKIKKIVAINVPKMSNLMHLDTWLTMLDYDKFLYSPNIEGVLKVWIIDLTKPTIEWNEMNGTLEQVLQEIIGKKPILIPIAGKDARQIDIDIETHFDGTNYLVIEPGVVIGYNRNIKTEQALKDAGIKVISWNGNQLSLGMGSARCMSMPLYREPIKK